jgi:Na+/H+ antiporter NhaC
VIPEAAAESWGAATLLPAILAITLALITREVLIALVGGVLCGAMLLEGVAHGPAGALQILITVTADADHAKIVVFTLGMGGMVGVAAGAGGTRGIVELVSRWAKTPRSGALSTWIMGMAIFFDDYASTLLVGNTMRPITDRLRIPREKLAYIVDSTAAPIASLALVSTWIGFEVSQLADAMKAAGFEQSAYSVFLAGIPSRFYPILALCFVAMVAWTQRDFGPMRAAEVRARTEGLLIREGGTPLMDASLVEEGDELGGGEPRAWLAIVPVATLIGVVLAVLAAKGADASYDALLYGSGAASLTAVIGAMATGSGMKPAVDFYLRGIRSMTTAIIVLILAWAIGKVMSDLKSGQYVASLVGESLPAWSLPTITFLLAAVMALATGSSWGTMTILFPIVVPVVAVHGVTGDAAEGLLIATSSSVLAGAVFGDHCSPISDTTVLSSIASASDHVDHTRTQIPYAALCGTVAIVLGTLPVGFGVPAPLLLILGLVACFGGLRLLGRPLPPLQASQNDPATSASFPAPGGLGLDEGAPGSARVDGGS